MTVELTGFNKTINPPVEGDPHQKSRGRRTTQDKARGVTRQSIEEKAYQRELDRINREFS